MSKSLLGKLNTLLQANLRGGIGSGRAPGHNLPAEVAQLRLQIEAAYAEQTTMQAQIAAWQAEIERWDAAADAALQAGREADARHAIGQIDVTRRRIAFQEADMREHERGIRELLEQVTRLEAYLQVTENAPDSAQSHAATSDNEPSIAEAIRQAREEATRQAIPLQVTLPASERIQVEVEDVIADAPPDSDMIEQDLAVRRSRLAKPDA